MKRLIPISFAALLSTATLAGCGLRGDLERPDPIFSEPEAEEVVETPAEEAPAAEAEAAPEAKAEDAEEAGEEAAAE